LFQAAAQLTGTERASFLNGACLGDPALRQRLEALLAPHDKSEALPPSDAPAAKATIKLDLTDAEDEAVGKQKRGQRKRGGGIRATRQREA
jgi:hypothetical protein